jgi:O-antigen/teichoic acid export membrane protein
LGQYGLVRQFALFLSQFLGLVINRVTVPVFSNIRNDLDRAHDADRTARTLITTAVTLLFGCFAASPHFVCRGVLGITSASAGVTLTILSIWAWSRTLTSYDLSLLTALGRVRALAVWQVAFAAIAALPLYAGARAGINGLAWAAALSGACGAAALWYFQVRIHFGMTTASNLLALIRAITVLIVASTLATAISNTSTPGGNALHFVLLSVASMVIMAIADRPMLRHMVTLIQTSRSSPPRDLTGVR